MKKISVLAILTVSCLMLCSCAKQRYVSHHEFAKRFNDVSSAVVIEENDFFYKDNEFNFFTGNENLRSIMLTLKENDRQRVTTAELTAVKDGKEFGENEKAELFNVFASTLTVILNCEHQQTLAELEKAGIDENIIDFKALTEEINILNAQVSIYSNSEMLSFRISIK